jgi:hypothetical protein
MAEQHIDGFDFETSSADLVGGNFWSGVNSSPNVAIDPTTFRKFGKSLMLSPGGGLFKNLTGTPGTIILAAGLTYTAGAAPEVQFWNTADQTGANITVTVDQVNHRLQVRAGSNNGSVLLSSANNSALAQTWIFFELKIVFSATVGSISLKIFQPGGANATVTASGLNTAPSGAQCASYTLQNDPSGSEPCWFDDHYCLDTTGGSLNDVTGADVVIEALFPNANVAVAFTPLSGSNFQMVDEHAMDGDTSYNKSTTVGNIDDFTVGALSDTPTTIYDVAVVSCARQETASTRALQNRLTSNATLVSGAAPTLAVSYGYRQDFIGPNDPNTGIAWTPSGVNAAKPGYKLTA